MHFRQLHPTAFLGIGKGIKKNCMSPFDCGKNKSWVNLHSFHKTSKLLQKYIGLNNFQSSNLKFLLNFKNSKFLRKF